MKIFRKELMLKRIKMQDLEDKIDDRALKLMNELDGKVAKKNEYRPILSGNYVVESSNGTLYSVSDLDLEYVQERCR